MKAVTETERGFTIVRRLAAPREAVFRAWTDPDQLQWFADAAPTERRPPSERSPTPLPSWPPTAPAR